MRCSFSQQSERYFGELSAHCDAYPEESLMVVNKQLLRQRVHQIFEGFFPENPQATVAYALKANPHDMVVHELLTAGVEAFDCASESEVRQILQASSSAEILFNHPIKTRKAISSALERGVRHFTVQDSEEIQKLSDLSTEQGIDDLELAVRVATPNAAARANLSLKFGADISRVSHLLHRCRKLFERAPGISLHVGSQNMDPGIYEDVFQQLSQQFPAWGVIGFLNLGGGLPANYEGLPGVHIEEYLSSLRSSFREHLAAVLSFDQGERLYLEPGRAVVAEAVSSVMPVLKKDFRYGTTVVYVADSIYKNFVSARAHGFEVPFHLLKRRAGEIVLQKNDEFPASQLEMVRVYGETCDSSDVLAELLLPKDLREGDALFAHSFGAYGSAAASTFNGFSPSRYVSVL